MKDFDRVMLIKDRVEYAQEGVHKGMVGTIMMSEERNGYILVFFDGAEYINKDGQRAVEEIEVAARVEDLVVLNENDPGYIQIVH